MTGAHQIPAAILDRADHVPELLIHHAQHEREPQPTCSQESHKPLSATPIGLHPIPDARGTTRNIDQTSFSRRIFRRADASPRVPRGATLQKPRSLQLDAIPPDGSFRFCDGHRTLEQVLADLLKHQAHHIEALRTALA